MSIADKITSIEEHLTADWESIENIGGSAEDKNIENIATSLNEIYDNLPKTIGEDTSLSLTTLKGKMNIIPKGDTEQTQYSGINLLQAKLQTTTDNGITVTNNNNGTFTINGTNTSSSLTTFRLDQSTQNGVDNLQNYEDGTYTLDLGIQNENIQITLMQVNTWQQFIATGMNVRLKSQAITGATGMFIYIAIKGNATLNNVVIKPMFVKGSYTTSTIPSFEPYVGGTASPNPTYPQNIEVVTGTQEVKVENVNLFVCRTDIAIGQSGTRNGITWERTGENTFLFNGTANADFTFIIDKPSHLLENLRKGDTYTLSGCPSGGSSSTYRLQIYHSNLTSTTIDTGEGKSFTANIQSESNVAILIYNGYTANNLEFNVQIEKGSTKTTFTPHQEQTQVVELSSKNLLNLSIIGKVPSVTNGNLVDSTTGACSDFIEVDNAKHYMLSFSGLSYMYAFLYGADKSYITAQQYNTSGSYDISTINNFNTCKYVRIRIDNKDYIESPQLEEGSSATSFEEYYNYELCKIGNYQDYLYKSNDKWYKKEQIGKVIINGSETGWAANGNVFYRQINNIKRLKIQMYSNFYNYKNVAWTELNNNEMTNDNASNTIFIKDTRYTILNDFKNFLSNNNMELYYLLATPNDIEITNTTLIEQLDNLEKMKSYNGVTNINCSGNLSAILSVSALKGE